MKQRCQQTSLFFSFLFKTFLGCFGWSLTTEDLDSNTLKSQEYNPGNTDVVVRLKKNQVLSIYYDGLSDESTKADDAKLIFTEYKQLSIFNQQ